MRSGSRPARGARRRGTTRLTRLGVLLALAAAVGVGASTATAQTPNPPPQFVPGACPAVPGPIPALTTARCGTLIVPESRSRPTGRTIRLSVAIVPARTPGPPDPIVWLAGGPGDDAIIEIPLALDGDLNRNRDVIFMSQRGTYTARPRLTCPPADRVGAMTIDLPYDSAAVGRAWIRATRACHRRFEARGIDLSAYNTIESAADLEDLRTTLGVPKWNVFGISYGTDHALTYMRLYPDGIRSVGIDGIFPPSRAGGAGAWRSAGEGIDAVLAACEADRACRARYGRIGATWRKLVARYERSPQTVRVRVEGRRRPVAVTISGGMLVQWAVSPGTHLAAQVPAAVDALAHGDPEPIAVPWATGRLSPAGVGILGVGLFNTVSCSEWVPYETEADVIASGRRAFPTFSRSIWRNAPNLPFMREACTAWDVPPAPASVRDVVESPIPTLVMSAEYDGQTGRSFGPLVARTLPNSTTVTIPNIAHVAFASPSPAANACAQRIVRGFFDVLNAVDTRCVSRVPSTRWVITPPRR